MAEPGHAYKTIPAGYGFGAIRFGCVGEARESVVTLGLHALPVDARSGSPTDNVTAAAQALGEAWLGAFPPAHMTNEWQFRGTKVSLWTTGQTAGQAPTDPVVGEWDQLTTGTAAQSTPPCSIALLVKKQTGMGGRSNRGRMFLPAGYLTEPSVDAKGNLVAGAVTTLQADADQFMENIQDADVGLVPQILHGMRKLGLELLPAAAPSPIVRFVVDALVATQRRRLRP